MPRRSRWPEIFSSFVDDPLYVAVDLRLVAEKISKLLVAHSFGARGLLWRAGQYRTVSAQYEREDEHGVHFKLR